MKNTNEIFLCTALTLVARAVFAVLAFLAVAASSEPQHEVKRGFFLRNK